MYLQVYKLHKVGSVGEALREAEVAVESAAERATNGDENVEIAAEAALLRVEVVEQILTSELQRAQREAADERACEKWRQQLTAFDEELMVHTTFFFFCFLPLFVFHFLYFGLSFPFLRQKKKALEQLADDEGLSSATYMCAARAALDSANEVRNSFDALLLLEQRLLIAGDKVRAVHQLVDRELMHCKKKADPNERMLQEKNCVEGANETFFVAKQWLAASWAMAEVKATAGHLFELALETAAVLRFCFFSLDVFFFSSSFVFFLFGRWPWKGQRALFSRSQKLATPRVLWH